VKEKRKKENNIISRSEPQAATSGRLPTWGPPQGRNTNIHPYVSPAKGVKKSEAPHINKDSSPLCVVVVFHRNFSSAGGTLPATIRQAKPSCQLPDIMLPYKMTFVALDLQIGHTLKDVIHN
jgi:hypothetical protein